MSSVERMIQSREIAKDQANAAIGRADDNFAAGSVTASAAVASALIYLADAILFCLGPVVQEISHEIPDTDLPPPSMLDGEES